MDILERLQSEAVKRWDVHISFIGLVIYTRGSKTQRKH